jgi:aspartyl-tRNA(Asn)/glutamyl-tRNA(Gln) amidotransferase subunit C
MSVTPDDVRHMARLARVGVEEHHVPSLVNELNGILAHMDVLQQAEVSGTTDAAVHADTPWRSDDDEADPLTRPREAFAPVTRDGFFLVPRLTTHEALGASAEEVS